MLNVLLQGGMLGVAMAAPIGPASLLCINNSLLYGIGAGLAASFGATVGIASFGALAGFGCTTITSFLTDHNLFLNVCGVLLLSFLGIKTFLSTPTLSNRVDSPQGLFNYFFTPFILTVANPMTVVVFISIYTGFGLETLCGGRYDAVIFTIGVFSGALTWLALLVLISIFFRRYINDKTMVWINKISAIILLLFALLSAHKVLQALELMS